MEFYSIIEVAKMSNQSQKTIRRHIASGKLKAKKVSNCYRIYKEYYDRWLISDLDPEADNMFRETIVEEQTGDKVNWIDISYYQNLSKEFIIEFTDKIYFDHLIKNKHISKEIKQFCRMFI